MQLTFEKATRSWAKSTTSGAVPEPRADSAAMAVQTFLFVYGGRRGSIVFNDLHVLNLGMSSLLEAETIATNLRCSADGLWLRIDTEPAFPVAVSSAAGVCDGNSIYVIGGRDDHQTYNYVYVMNVGTGS